MDGDVVLDVVSDPDKDVVSFACAECGPGELAVDGHDGFRGTEPAGVPRNHLDCIRMLIRTYID